MISHEARCLYQQNPLAEVICQLRFPEILSIETELPAAFQEAIRDVFPRYTQRKEGLPGKQTNNYQFATADNGCRVNLTSKFVSLAVSRYTCWEDFARMLDKPLAAFIRIYKPAYFERVGLRYLNFISRSDLGLEGIPFSSLIQPCYLGLLGEEDIAESSVTRCGIDAEVNLRGGCKAKIHAGPGLVKRNGKSDPEVKFVFDQDLFMPGNVPINVSAGALETLHRQAWPIFRGAVTPMLHNALDPEEI